ncbi:FUSC family protein [Mycolicibacterium hodleri]|nr:FUSC family protein [Mycolicibacterium hodleri]
MPRFAARLKVADPGFVRSRRSARTTCATILSGLTLAALTSVLGAVEALRISLFGAGACFFATLLVTDVRPGDRARTFGWASVSSAAAIVVTVELSRTAVWAAAAFLVVQMFMFYALRPLSLRTGNVLVISALITFLVGAMRITANQIGWFVLASTVGFAWIALAEYVILKDDPIRSLKRSVSVFCHSAGGSVALVVGVTTMTSAGRAPRRAEKALRRSLDRAMRCRRGIESQLSGTLPPELARHDIEQIRVALYCAERGIEQFRHGCESRWLAELPDDIAASVTTALMTLANALRGDIDVQSLDVVALECQCLRDRIHDATTTAPASALAAVTLVGGAELLAQSASRASILATDPSVSATLIGSKQTTSDRPPGAGALAATTILAIQAAVAAVLAGVIAKWLGNEQSLLVGWTAYVIIAGSAEASSRRAWIWFAATILGATAGVATAASVPDDLFWTVAVVTVGVFFTAFSAPVSYPAMVFWMNIALVPLFATEGRYLDLVWDKTAAALIGGCVAGAVALTVAPIRLSRNVRPAVLHYLDAMDAALEAQLPGEAHRRATAGAALDRAHSALDAMIASAVVRTRLFPRQVGPLTEQAVRVDAVHEAFLRLTPLLTESARRHDCWTDSRLDLVIRLLRQDVEAARVAACGDAAPAATYATLDEDRAQPLWPANDLRARLAELAQPR